MPNSRDPRSRPRSMSIDRTKRILHHDSEDDDNLPPTKVHASGAAPEDPQPSTSSHRDLDDDFHFQGREYRRARKAKHEELKIAESMPKDAPTSRPESGAVHKVMHGQQDSASQPNEALASRPRTSAVSKILIPATEGFRSPVHVAEALEDELNLHGQLPMKFLHSRQVLLSPRTQELHDMILQLRELKGKPILLRAASENSTTKGVLLRYPLLMPISPILKNPLVLSAERLTTRDGEETRQVLITVRGPLPGTLELGNWGTFYTRPYSKEPLRCFHCQKFGHHKANCTLPAKCGVCAGRHETEKCIKTHKEGGETTAKCPNCHEAHHAWNRSCTARREIVEVQRANQHEWMVRHRPALANNSALQGRSALALTSTWGSRTSHPAAALQESSQQVQPPSPDHFPELGAAARQPRTGSRPRQRINLARPPVHAPPTPPQTSPQTDLITLSKQDLQAMFTTFATSLVSMLGKQIPAEDITSLTEKVVATVSQKQPAPLQPPRRPSPPPRPRSPSPSRTSTSRASQGITPASASIDREKALLGLMQKPNAARSSAPTTPPTETTHLPTSSTSTTQATQTTKKTCKKHKDGRSKSYSGTASRSRTSTIY